MSTAGVDPNLASNLQLLQQQSLKVEFHLDHTDYKKVENIGTGAYGVVCSAINRKTRQRVAIKKIPNLFTMDPRYAIRTYREVKILQHFKHDNIIAIREILQPANKDISDIYVVMDLMESDLHKIIYSKQSLTDEHVQYFLYQILRGLKYIHSAHVIHRDLKPSNLLVNGDCELKIGDFGMARGVNFRAEKSNQQMTQYVATRWYRAPELIVASRQGYGPAIDMWSVGCIFAEMLRRKHLFPGRDLLNQLTVIFRTLGIPSKQYLQLLDSETVCGFIRKITDSDEFKPKTYAELCPKASSQAIDLLSKMLVIEPEKRIDVETALTHPFLAKYHDRMQEPRCNKTFDFAFEQELVNLQNDDQKRVKIQELLRKEVVSYRKPQPVDFGALIPSKSADSSQADNDPYADLNAFLAQLASPDKESSSTTSQNPLLGDTKPSNAQQFKNSNSLLESQSVNPLLAGAVKDSKESKPANPLLANNLPFQKSNYNPLLFGATKPNPLLESADSKFVKTDIKSEKAGSDAPIIASVVVATTSESDQSNDTELFNSFIRNHEKKNTDTSDTLTVNTLAKAAVDDIEMISAKLKQTELADEKKEEKPDEEVESKVQDTKSILRQRLMDKQNANAGQVKGQDKAPGKTSVTAHQRQKEREERRRKKREKAQEKKKIKKNENGGHFLTSEDQKMLDRWKQMAKPKHIQPKPSGPNNTIVSTGGSNVIVVYPAGGGATTYISSNVPPASTAANTNQSAINPPSINVSHSNQIHMNPPAPVDVINNTNPANQLQANHPINPVGNNHMHMTAGQHTIQPNPLLVGQHHTNQSTNGQLHMSQMPNNQMTVNRQTMGHMQLNQPMNNQIHTNQPMNNQMAMNQTHSNQMHMRPTNTATAMSQNMVHAIPGVNSFMSGNTSQRVSHPIRSFSDIAALHGHADVYSDNSQEPSLYDYNQPVPNIMYHNTAQVHRPEPPAHLTEQFSHWNNTMSVNTTLDIGGLVGHKNDDGIPPMLVSTPKGTGGGYGVGFDMESMMAYNPDFLNIHMDSAPLSASLLADWMDVTSTMDPKALEDIQRELELNDFPFNY